MPIGIKPQSNNGKFDRRSPIQDLKPMTTTATFSTSRWQTWDHMNPAGIPTLQLAYEIWITHIAGAVKYFGVMARLGE